MVAIKVVVEVNIMFRSLKNICDFLKSISTLGETNYSYFKEQSERLYGHCYLGKAQNNFLM